MSTVKHPVSDGGREEAQAVGGLGRLPLTLCVVLLCPRASWEVFEDKDQDVCQVHRVPCSTSEEEADGRNSHPATVAPACPQGTASACSRIVLHVPCPSILNSRGNKVQRR